MDISIYLLLYNKLIKNTGESRQKQTAWWRHQMETFSALLAIRAENSPVPRWIPAQWAVTRSFGVIFDRVWINGWVNNLQAGDLRRYRAHYDVIVMGNRRKTNT